MNKDIAAKVMKEMLDLGVHLNATVAQIKLIEDEEERKQLTRAVGNLMGLIYTDVMVPIIREYPDLDPDKSDPDHSDKSDS